MRKLLFALKAARELGFRHVGLYALYQLGKRSGYWRWRTPVRESSPGPWPVHASDTLPLPNPDRVAVFQATDSQKTFSAADQILHGRVTLFGGVTAPLQLTLPGPLGHWTRHESAQWQGRDIKFVWEPARFGWAFALGRAYHLSGDERYPAAFWHHLETFVQHNPPNRGPHWASAQEVGLRILAFAFAARALAASRHTTSERLALLSGAIAAHAARIPPTLVYARAQNNNHLLSEAAALYTAALLLPSHPRAPRWRGLGWRWLHHGLQTQIEPGGSYVQQSTSYHRLMLQLALWTCTLAQRAGQPFPQTSLERLAAATRWLLALCDPDSGRVPNLGPNDGALILPLTACPHHDYRPTLQAAARAFLGQPAFPPGPWDELGAWMGIADSGAESSQSRAAIGDEKWRLDSAPFTIHHPAAQLRTGASLPARAILRVARFAHRPGHADQLHLDLWWRGLNVARDPGTYLYNADPPWDNSLATAFVHNTLTIDGRDQMTRAGRFLYLDRAQAQLLEHTPTRLAAQHDGYRALGLIHRRTVEALDNGWRITDHVAPRTPARRTPRVRLHWLLPDWPWELEGSTLRLQSPYGRIEVSIASIQDQESGSRNRGFEMGPGAGDIALFRAGEALHGNAPAHPTWGWYSPTYGVKEPALAFVLETAGPAPLTLVSQWAFPG